MRNRGARARPPALGPGTVLDGKYEILTLLGSGGMGQVFKARHLHLETFRCIKVLRQSLLDDEIYRARFLREAQLATQIHHANVAVVHDFFLGEGGSYMVTEFIDGSTLRQWCGLHGALPIALAADVATQVLAGLDHIHRRGLLHRDISSDNIMLSHDPEGHLRVKIIDLGIAKDVNTAAPDTTQSGMLIGNPKYMSPEQLGNLPAGEQLDGRADLYCLGVVLYEMLIGSAPFASDTPNGYMVKHLMHEPPSFHTAKPGLVWPEGLEGVVFRALEKDRRRRYADAREFATALTRFLVAPAGTLTRAMVKDLRRGPDDSFVQSVRTIAPDSPTEVTSQPARRDQVDEGSAFDRAWELGTPAVWREFVEAFPRSPRTERARLLLDEAVAFEAASSSESDTGLREFLRKWPDGRHQLEAEIRLGALKRTMAESAFAQAVSTDTYVAYRDFLARYGTSEKAAAAHRATQERLAFETALAVDSEEAWEEYLAQWGEDAHAHDARAHLERAREREEAAYRVAVERRHAAGWNAFLDEFPAGKRRARAEINRREAVAFEAACRGGKAELIEFVRLHEHGLLVKEAKRLLRQKGDEDDYAQALAVGTAAAWQLYLVTHPSAAHAATAREFLTALEDDAFAELLASKSPQDGAAFLDDFPDSARRAEVVRLIARWEEPAALQQAFAAVDRGDFDGAAELLAKLSDPAAREELAAALETARDKASWEIASRVGSSAALEAYLAERPGGRWAGDARKRLALERTMSGNNESRAWNDAWEIGTSDAWDRYLATYATSEKAAEAKRCRQEAADFAVAVQKNSASMWRAFLKTWPEGRHRLDAELRLRSKA